MKKIEIDLLDSVFFRQYSSKAVNICRAYHSRENLTNGFCCTPLAVNFKIELNVSCLGCTARFSVETWIILLKGFVARVWSWMSGRNFGDQDTRKKTLQFVRLALRTYSFSPVIFTTSGKGTCSSILTWCRSHRDQQGGGPRPRLFHCTPDELTPAIVPNVDYSGT